MEWQSHGVSGVYHCPPDFPRGAGVLQVAQLLKVCSCFCHPEKTSQWVQPQRAPDSHTLKNTPYGGGTPPCCGITPTMLYSKKPLDDLCNLCTQASPPVQKLYFKTPFFSGSISVGEPNSEPPTRAARSLGHVPAKQPCLLVAGRLVHAKDRT